MENRKVENVVIINDFNYVQGGASKVAIGTAKMLKDDFKIYFFSAVNKEEENIDGIQYITTNQKEVLKEKNKLKGAINGIYNFKAKRKLRKLLKQLDPDTTIVHVHGWTKALSSSVFDIAFKMKFKVVLTLHDYFTACPNGGYFNYVQNEICHLKPLSWKCVKCNCDSRNYGFKLYRLVRQFVQNKVVKLNDKLEYAISISDFSEKILKQTFGEKVKMTKIYNPIDIDEVKEKIDIRQNEYFLYVGRISKEKGVDIFCQAITELGYKGIVVGDGEEKENLDKIYTNIDFVGWKNKEEVVRYLKGAKALIFPSRCYETAGLTILEAQKIGIPCIASANSAGKEFIKNGCNGYIFETIDELKKYIEKIQNNELEFIRQKNNHNYTKELKEFYLNGKS